MPNLTVNGVTFNYPSTGASNWGTDATGFAQAVATGMLQKAGGNFSLTADVNFGANFGVLSQYFTSRTASPASAGIMRLANVDAIKWRNSTNTGDIALGAGSSDTVAAYAGVDLANVSGAQTLTNKTMSGASNTFTNLPISALATGSQYQVLVMGSSTLGFGQLNLSQSAGVTGTLLAAQFPALAGDVTSVAGGLTTTLAAITNSTITTLTALTSVGTIATGVWAGTSVAVAHGGTGLTAGTSGGIPYYSSTSAMTSSGLLAQYGVVLGGGAGASPVTLTPNASTAYPLVSGGVSAGPSWALLTTAGGGTGVASTATFPSSGTVLAGTPNQYGVVLSGAAGTVSVLTPDASTTKVLTSGGASANPSWQPAGTASPLTTKGDIYTYASTNARHAVPGDYGRLIPDSGQTDGWRNATYSQFQNGRPGKNYIQYADFENNSATLGWTLTGCATVTNGLPASVGTGAAAFSSSNGGRAKNTNTNAAAVDSSSAIAGTYALNLATTGAGAIGDGYISSAYTIDAADQAKVLAFKLYYKVATVPASLNMSGTSANTYAVAIYDPANNAWLGTAGQFNFTQSSGVGICQGTFQTASNTTSIQIFIYSPVAPTATSSLLIDDVYVGPQSLAFGAAMTDWTAFTPTGTWSTNTTYVGYYRRHGDSVDLQYQVSLAGAPTTATLTVNLPSGMTIDTTKLPSNKNSLELGFTGGTAAGNGFAGFVQYNNTTSIQPTVLIDGSTASKQNLGAITQVAPYTFANGDGINVTVYDLPIVGWSSNTSMSADTDTRVVAAAMTGATATVTGSYSDVTWTTVASDTHGAMGVINYTVPVTGYYNVTGALFVGATSLSAAGGFLASLFNTTTSTTLRENQYLFDLNVPENESLDFSYHSVLLSAGTQIKIQIKTSGTVGTPVIGTSATLNYLSIQRASGPAVVAATETVACKYYNTAGTSVTSSTATIPFATKVQDTHGAFNGTTGVFTAPVSGTYAATTHLLAAINQTTAGAFEGWFKVTSTPEGLSALAAVYTATFGNGASHNQTIGWTGLWKLNAGDTIEAQADSTVTTTLDTTAHRNEIAIWRVGN